MCITLYILYKHTVYKLIGRIDKGSKDYTAAGEHSIILCNVYLSHFLNLAPKKRKQTFSRRNKPQCRSEKKEKIMGFIVLLLTNETDAWTEFQQRTTGGTKKAGKKEHRTVVGRTFKSSAQLAAGFHYNQEQRAIKQTLSSLSGRTEPCKKKRRNGSLYMKQPGSR